MKYKCFELLRHIDRYGCWRTEDESVIEEFRNDNEWIIKKGWVEIYCWYESNFNPGHYDKIYRISSKFMSGLERGCVVLPRKDYLVRIAKVLRIDSDKLIEWLNKKPDKNGMVESNFIALDEDGEMAYNPTDMFDK